MERMAQCHCGSLRVTTSGNPEWVNLCHCRSCQRRTGSLLHSGAYFTKTRVRIAGVSRVYSRDADSGYGMSFNFCPVCGSNVYWEASRFPNHFGIAVGAFADFAFPPPSFSVWEESMHRWVGLPAGLERFERGRIGPPLGTRDPAE